MCFDLNPPINPPIHPPTHQTIHPPMGGGVFTDFKSSNGIEISQLVQVLLNFDWFRGSLPSGVGSGWMGVGVSERMPLHMYTCTCMHAHVCTHMHVWHHRESPGFPQIQWGWPFAWNYHVYHPCICVCVHVHACTHVCGASPTHINPPPRAAGSQKPKFNNSRFNRDNSILFKDSLPLNIPELI